MISNFLRSLLLVAFTANAFAQGSAQLTWVAPTENTDGSELTDLSGFRVYWGEAPGNYTNSVQLNSPSLTSYTVQNLTPGTWYFAATAYNSSNIESAFSNEASKLISDTQLLDPRAPTMLTVAGGNFAYRVQPSNDYIALVRIGTVEATVECDPNIAVADSNGVLAHMIPADSVTPFAGQEVIAAFAECGS